MNVTASPIPITVDGTEYQIHPLTDQASHNITQWLRADLMASAWLAEGSIQQRGGNPQPFAKSILQACLDVQWTDKNGAAVLRTDRGLSRLLLESLKPSVPGITQNMTAALLKVEGTKDDFWRTFLAVNDFEEVDESFEKKKRRQDGNEGGAIHASVQDSQNPADGPGTSDTDPVKPARP